MGEDCTLFWVIDESPDQRLGQLSEANKES